MQKRSSEAKINSSGEGIMKPERLEIQSQVLPVVSVNLRYSRALVLKDNEHDRQETMWAQGR